VGPWLVAPSLNKVSRNGTTVQLEPKVMSVLVCLAEHPGEPVSKEKLLQTVWPDTFVGEGVLVRSIVELRRVFEDDAKEPRVIQTIAKRGYRLVAPVVPMNGAASTHEPRAQSPESIGRPRYRKPWRLAVAVTALAGIASALLILFNIGGMREHLFGLALPAIHSLAILPLDNLSGDPSQEYFASGMTDALITEISRVRELRVISRTSVLPYKGTGKQLHQIAQELNVDGLVEGTVQRSGNRVRVTVQLIDGRQDRHIWANGYERNIEDVLSLEEDLAAAIAREIRVQLRSQPELPGSANHPKNLKALEAYLKAQYERDLASPLLGVDDKGSDYDAHLDKAIAYLQDAIDADPNYAPAYVAMSEVWAWEKPNMGPAFLHDSTNLSKARAVLEKALSLDPLISEAHTNRGRFAFIFDWDWLTAEREFRRAIELNPSSAAAHEYYLQYLEAMGKSDEAVKELEILQSVDPGNHFIPAAYYYQRQFSRAIELRRVNVERKAYGASAHYDLAFPLVRVGNYKEAIDEWIETMVEVNYPDMANHLRSGYTSGGFKGAISAWVAELDKLKDSPLIPANLTPYLYALLGDKDRVFPGLDSAVRRHDESVLFLKVNPDWDSVRSDPRFADLVRRLGLPQ